MLPVPAWQKWIGILAGMLNPLFLSVVVPPGIRHEKREAPVGWLKRATPGALSCEVDPTSSSEGGWWPVRFVIDPIFLSVVQRWSGIEVEANLAIHCR